MFAGVFIHACTLSVESAHDMRARSLSGGVCWMRAGACHAHKEVRPRKTINMRVASR